MIAFYLTLVDAPEEKSKVEQLYIEYRALMKHIALSILQDEALAEDAVHDAFVRIIRHLDKVDNVLDYKTRGFVVIVIRDVSYDLLKREKRDKVIPMERTRPFLSCESADERLEIQDWVERINRLPERYRSVLALKIFYEYSDRQIAQMLGISYAAERKRLERARKALAEMMQE